RLEGVEPPARSRADRSRCRCPPIPRLRVEGRSSPKTGRRSIGGRAQHRSRLRRDASCGSSRRPARQQGTRTRAGCEDDVADRTTTGLRTLGKGEVDVYVSLTRVSTSDQPTGNATIIAQEMIRWFRATDGFLGLLFLSKEGTTLTLTFWDDREVAERHRASR